jgi:IS605 OrfB family transposase
VPVSREFAKLHGKTEIRIPFPERLEGKTIKKVRILPVHNGLDPGIDNLATCIPSNGTPFIIDGRTLKSYNRCWNKQKAYYQAIADHRHIEGITGRKTSLSMKCNNRVNDYIRKSARYIINYCIDHNIGTVVVGCNKDFKRNSSLNKQNNQNFVQLPLGNLREYLSFLHIRYGMRYIEQEESYTSKSNYLASDELPVYKAEQPYTGTFSGKRVHRGLYVTNNGEVMNADVNRAANILRKVSGCSYELPYSGCLAHPLRIRLA